MLDLQRPKGFLQSTEWNNEKFTNPKSVLSVRDVRLGHIYKTNFTASQQKPKFHTGVLVCRDLFKQSKYRASPYALVPSLNPPDSVISWQYGHGEHTFPANHGYVAQRDSAY
jgi:hypothetical protein